MVEFVANYRRSSNINGKLSYSNLYTSISVLAGHYASYGPKFPVPEKRRKRLLQVGSREREEEEEQEDALHCRAFICLFVFLTRLGLRVRKLQNLFISRSHTKLVTVTSWLVLYTCW